MANRKIVSIHSFRGGTGKSNTTANLASQVALAGKRVGIVDTDIQSPGIHVLFGLDEGKMGKTINDFLHGKCAVSEVAFNIGEKAADAEGRVKLVGREFWLFPSSIRGREMSQILREGYDVNRLNEGFQTILKELQLDYLFIDTHPGLNEETLLSIAISDVLVIIMRPDQQDYQGTGVTVEVARKLSVPCMMLVVNKVPAVFPEAEVRARVEKAYQADVAAVLPHSDEMMALASAGVFVTRYPDHPITGLYRQLVEKLMA